MAAALNTIVAAWQERKSERATAALHDALARPLRDLRISVTDRCNFRCVYCMPRAVFDKDYPFLPHSALLTLEEIERLARLFVAQGVTKIRLTGGEPLLRKNIEFLIERLAALRTVDGTPLDLTLTTNGSLLARKARALRDAGLTRVTVSLDALDDTLFRRMNDADFSALVAYVRRYCVSRVYSGPHTSCSSMRWVTTLPGHRANVATML